MIDLIGPLGKGFLERGRGEDSDSDKEGGKARSFANSRRFRLFFMGERKIVTFRFRL